MIAIQKVFVPKYFMLDLSNFIRQGYNCYFRYSSYYYFVLISFKFSVFAIISSFFWLIVIFVSFLLHLMIQFLLIHLLFLSFVSSPFSLLVLLLLYLLDVVALLA